MADLFIRLKDLGILLPERRRRSTKGARTPKPSPTERNIRKCKAIVQQNAITIAASLLKQMRVTFKKVKSLEEAVDLWENKVMPRFARGEYVAGAAYLAQTHRFFVDFAYDAERILCEAGDDFYYFHGNSISALVCFAVLAGLDPEYALHGVVMSLAQGLFHYAQALPYAILVDRINPHRRAESYVREKIRWWEEHENTKR